MVRAPTPKGSVMAVIAVGVVALACAGLPGFAPGPFAGSSEATVLVASENPGPNDVDVFEERLSALGISGRVAARGEMLELTLSGVGDSQEVLDALLSRFQLTFHEVLEAEHLPVQGEQEVEHCWGVSTLDRQCKMLRLGPAAMDGRSVAKAKATLDSVDGMPRTVLHFTDHGARVFGDLTTRLVGRQLVVAVDGEVVSAPVVREPIEGGRAEIVMDTADPRGAEQEATALAAALQAPPLVGDWHVVERR